MMNVAIYSIVPIEFPDHQEQYLGWIAMAEGVACAFGPLLGSLVYGWLGYIGTFYFFTVYIALFGFGSVYLIPARVNTITDEADDEENEEKGNPDLVVTYCDILKCRKAVAALNACILGMVCCAFIDPTLSVQLTSMGMHEFGIGMVFAAMGISWGFGSTFGGWLCEKASRKLIM